MLYLAVIHVVPDAIRVFDEAVVVARVAGEAKVNQHRVEPEPLTGTLREGGREGGRGKREKGKK